MKNEKLLEEIRKRFRYLCEQWRSIRAEAREDMRYVAGDPWDPQERQSRKDHGRPCLSFDELSQYLNVLVNDLRLNKRSIRVTPEGEGANDETARFRANLIRAIEYKSKAQSAYATAFEDACQRGYGYFRISKKYVGEDSFDQELVIKRIPNPDSVFPDWDAKEADLSDMEYCFVIDHYSKEQFDRNWPGAEFKDFSGEMIELAPQWISDDRIQVAEYWKVEKKKRKLLLLENGQKAYLDELDGAKVMKLEGVDALVFPDGSGGPLMAVREVESRQIKQFITNGVEILEEAEWDGKWIPIVAVLGKEQYIDNGAGSQRNLLSLIRLARDPAMLYNYYRTTQAELVSMSPKTPWIGFEGQFEGHEDEWALVNRVPIPFLQVKATTEATGGQVLPLPTRNSFEPAIQSLEFGAESCKRAIQSALGMFNASIGKQDSAAKSGVAIKALETQSSQGNYHFVDNFDRALEHAGRILEDMIDKVYDAPREVGVREPDDTNKVVAINQPYVDESGQEKLIQTGVGRHEVTISVGPSYQSEREEAAATADALLGNQQAFPLVADLAIKLKNLGPIGDQLSERLKLLLPPQVQQPDDKQAAAQQAAQMQGQLEQAMQLIDAMKAQLDQLTDERQAKVLELQSKERIAAIQAQTQMMVAEERARSAEGVEIMRGEMAKLQQQIQMMYDGQIAEFNAQNRQAELAAKQVQQVQEPVAAQ